MTQTNEDKISRIQQGDILKDVEYIESITTENGNIQISKIIFPLVIVLTQDCDLTWDYDARGKQGGNQDKYLLSVLVAPLYNYEHFIIGDHLSKLGQKMTTMFSQSKTNNQNLKNNEKPRYHYLEFAGDVPIVNSVIDFKHYFSVNVEYLRRHKEKNYICTISPIFREQISQRFSNFLSRIGLPPQQDEQNKT